MGSVAYGLVVAPDIDLEVYCDRPTVEAGFAVVAEIAPLPHVWRVRFSNELDGDDQGLYWQIRYRPEAGDVWKIDTWLLARDHPGPKAADAVEALRRALDDEKRTAILEIKEALAGRNGIRSIDVYRAVVDDGVRSSGEFARWHERNASTGIVDWHPRDDRRRRG